MNRIAQLDGLRFFAVLSVMIGHWMQWQWTDPILLKIPFAHGVTLFFVLSGYLITGILIRSKEKIESASRQLWRIVRQFYIRRFLRIFPIYYLLIIFLMLIEFENIKEVLLVLLTYTSNIYISITENMIGHFTHLWSLAVEEQFYLIWPFVVLFLSSKKLRILLYFLLLFSLLFKIFSFNYLGNWHAAAYSTLGCMLSLILGALIADLKLHFHKIASLISNPFFVNITLGLYVISILFTNLNDVLFYRVILEPLVFSIVAALIVLRGSEGNFKGPIKLILENSIVRYIGKISYGMYLYHGFMSPLFVYLTTNYYSIYLPNKNYDFFILFGQTLIISMLSWHLIELPINKLKHKFPYVKRNTEI